MINNKYNYLYFKELCIPEKLKIMIIQIADHPPAGNIYLMVWGSQNDRA